MAVAILIEQAAQQTTTQAPLLLHPRLLLAQHLAQAAGVHAARAHALRQKRHHDGRQHLQQLPGIGAQPRGLAQAGLGTLLVAPKNVAQDGRAIGLAVGWRMTFAVVGGLSAIAVVYQAAVFPAMPAGERFTVKQLPELLKNPFLIALYAVTVFMATGYYASYSYIEPFLAQVAHVDAGAITMTLTAFGCSGLLGSWLFGRLFDGHRFPFLAITLSGVPAALLLMAPAASALVLVLAVCALWGCCSTAFNVAFQAELIKYTPADSSAVAMSIFSGLFNLGIGTGTAIGGAVVSGPGIAWIGFVGGAIAVVGVILAITVLFPAIRRAKPVA